MAKRKKNAAAARGGVPAKTLTPILDNTPLLDIKPYIPKFDAFEAKRIGWCGGVKGGSIAVADGGFEG